MGWTGCERTGLQYGIVFGLCGDLEFKGGEEEDVYFFTLPGEPLIDDVVAEYKRRCLKPDLYAQMAVNETDPAFSHDYPNVTTWKLQEGTYVDPNKFVYSTAYCKFSQSKWGDQRYCSLNLNGPGCKFDRVQRIRSLWFSGVRI